jgi:hypothetical protein
VSQALKDWGYVRGHFTFDRSKATLLVMMLNGWASRHYSYGLITRYADELSDTHEVHEYKTYKGKTRETPYYIDIEQTLANFQRLYGEETHERVSCRVPAF